jgi:NhaP-type Na+/H+ or K+/H+ antiporter
MSSRPISLSERVISALLGALLGCVIGLAVAWLLMFSSTLYMLDVGSHPVSFVKSATAGAVFFATAGCLLGSSAGTLVGYVLAGLFEFERLYDRRNFWAVELLLILVGVVVILWVNGVFAA